MFCVMIQKKKSQTVLLGHAHFNHQLYMSTLYITGCVLNIVLYKFIAMIHNKFLSKV